ncbi:hypothetical protein GCM10009129_00220 [Psychrobacter aestuarii]|uniref:Uncharacterized protein n=1 Tax=Psychrobacter aestuarii TaxID=556327 RepID=A0ABN0VJA2_9GAMM
MAFFNYDESIYRYSSFAELFVCRCLSYFIRIEDSDENIQDFLDRSGLGSTLFENFDG